MASKDRGDVRGKDIADVPIPASGSAKQDETKQLAEADLQHSTDEPGKGMPRRFPGDPAVYPGTEPGDPLAAIQDALKQLGDEYGDNHDPARNRYPALWALLARVKLPSGKMKEPASLSVRLSPVGVDLTLSDVSLGYKLLVSCTHLDQALEALELAIKYPGSKWVPLRYGEGYQARKTEERKLLDRNKKGE